MRYVFIAISAGVIEKVSFYDDPSTAIEVLSRHAKTICPERDDAAVYGPDGLIVNAKVFRQEEETRPIYIIANPCHSLGFLVLSLNEPLGYVNPLKAICDLEKLRKEYGRSVRLYKVKEIIWPLFQKSKLERHNAGMGVEDFNYSLVQEYLS